MWIPESLPMQLKKYREARGLSQRALAAQTGLVPGHISEFERGSRTPQEDTLSVLGGVLGFDPENLKRRTHWQAPAVGRPEGSAERLLLHRFTPDLRDLFHPRRRKDFAFHMAAVRDRFASVLQVVEPRFDALPNRQELELFLRDVPVDSADEAAFDIHVASMGVGPARVSPADLGFFAHAVIDPDRRVVVGHRRRPTFGLETPTATFAFQPQVAVRPADTIIMDMLAGVHEGTTSWVDCEVDGGGHDSSRDDARARALGLPTLRVDTEMLHDPEFGPRLLKTLLWIHRNSFRGVVRQLLD